MGMKKLSRKRLFDVEKLGKSVDVDTGQGMRDAIASATQHREGHKVVTDIILDLGTSKAVIKSGGLVEKTPCGVSGSTNNYVNVCKVTDSVFGNVTSLEVVALEAATDGTLTDYMIMSSSAQAYFGSIYTANGSITGSNAGNPSTINSLATVGSHQYLTFDNRDLRNQYIYIGAGASTATAANKGSSTITVSTANTGSIVGSITSLGLRANDAATGTVVNFSASVTDAFGASAVAGQFNIKDADTANEIAQGISLGIHNHGSFTTDAASRGGSSATITVTHAGLTWYGNQTNPGWSDAPDNTTAITVSDFTNAHPSQFTSGKLLLRFTGFMEPDDY